MIILLGLLVYVILGTVLMRFPRLIVPSIIILSPLERFNIYVGFTLSPLIIFFPLFISLFFFIIWRNREEVKFKPNKIR